MRRTLATATVAGLLLALATTAPTAYAGKPTTPSTQEKLNLQTCSAKGGTFSQSQGTKYCTYTETLPTTNETVEAYGPYVQFLGVIEYRYKSVRENTTTGTRTVTLEQKNMGLIVTTYGTPDTETESVMTSCTKVYYWDRGDVIGQEDKPNSECESEGL